MANDEELLEAKIDRFYDIYADEYDYRELEGLIKKFASTLDASKVYSTREFLNLFGKYQYEKGIRSITAAAWKNKVPVYSPGLIDSGYGVALSLLKREGKLIRLDQTQDMEELGQIAERTKRTGVVYIGGGVPKDTIQLATIIKSLSEGGEEETPHDYAIQITTDSPQWGGLSGCTLEEAISWGKIAADSKRSVVYCDATLALPLIAHAMNEKVKSRKDPPDLELGLQEQVISRFTASRHPGPGSRSRWSSSGARRSWWSSEPGTKAGSSGARAALSWRASRMTEA